MLLPAAYRRNIIPVIRDEIKSDKKEKGMNIEYEKDNKERVPFEHYKEEYVKKDPLEISNRTGFPFSEEKQCFTIRKTVA